MTKWRLFTSASMYMTAAGVVTALAQTPGTSGATETMTGAQVSADYITCEDIVDLDDAVAGQVMYYVAGYIEGQRTATLDHGETPNDDTQTGLGDETASDLDIEIAEDNAETDGASVFGGASSLLNIELDVEQVRSICEDDPRMTISAVIEQVGS